MTHPTISEALAAEHRRDLLAQAEAARLARAARRARPARSHRALLPGRAILPGLAALWRRTAPRRWGPLLPETTAKAPD